MGKNCGWSLFWLLFGALTGTALSGSVNLSVGLDPNRPVGLYEGPATYRRDSRGRPFKSIIIRANPFHNNADSNLIPDRLINTTSDITNQQPREEAATATTASPLPNAAPNRPFKSFLITSKPFGLGNADSNSVRDRSTSTTTVFFDNNL